MLDRHSVYEKKLTKVIRITLIVVLKKLLVNILIAESCDTHNS